MQVTLARSVYLCWPYLSSIKRFLPTDQPGRQIILFVVALPTFAFRFNQPTNHTMTILGFLCLLGSLGIQVYALATHRLIERDDGLSVMMQSISAEMSSPTFVPYSQPSQNVEEFIALGDSYTAGTGANGIPEDFAGDALRGRHAYPMQMASDAESWAAINNGDDTLPRLSFHAYTGDLSMDLVNKQLQQGEYKDDKMLPRTQHFGKPQLAVVTIGGNDAKLTE
jgi:hypothetical protein